MTAVKDFLRRIRSAAIYVEYRDDGDELAVAAAIRKHGGLLWEIDGDVDLEHYPQGGVHHAAAVFRFRPGDTPMWEFLSAVAQLPGVYAVCER